MPGRTFNSDAYRYGANSGSEKDDEITGVVGAHYTTEFRELDTRLGGRWWSPDPIVKPWESPYAGFSNNPIYYSDPTGLDPGDPVKKDDASGDKGSTAPNGGTRGGKGDIKGGEAVCIGCGDSGEDIYGMPEQKTTPEAQHQAQVLVNELHDQIAHYEAAEAAYTSEASATPGLWKLMGGGFPDRIYEEADAQRLDKIASYYQTNEIVRTSYYDYGGQTTPMANGGLQSPAIDPIDLFAGGLSSFWKSSTVMLEKEVAEDVMVGAAKASYQGTGKYCVYQLVEPKTGIVKYVGITSQDLMKRFAQHAAKDPLKAVLVPQMIQSFGSTLSKQQARALEQVLIDMYRLGKNGGQLLNKINSIAK